MSEIIRLDKYLADMGCGPKSGEAADPQRAGGDQRRKDKNRNRRSLLLRIVYAWQEKKSVMKNIVIICFINRPVMCRQPQITGIKNSTGTVA